MNDLGGNANVVFWLPSAGHPADGVSDRRPELLEVEGEGE